VGTIAAGTNAQKIVGRTVWKRSQKILITVPPVVHIVDGSHFALDTAPDEIAARVREFMDMPKESVQGEEIMATATTPARPPFPPFTRDSAMQKVASLKMLGILAILQR